MTTLAHGISPEWLQALGWTLLHFVWQGAALGALFAVAITLCHRATTRYALAVMTLVLMMAAPVITFTELREQNNDPAVRYRAQGASASAAKPIQGVSAAAPPSAPAPEVPASQPAVILFVEAWFLGVVLLSLRTAGGLFLIERMRSKEIKPVGGEIYGRCIALQWRMGFTRVIRFCECDRLDAPAAFGWIRPVVLLPVRALSGLTEDQIDAVIAHELAHIRRLDCFVNLFQIGVETLLFYHPAVWWVSQRIRVEREHCCDDEAVALCGDAVDYARALTLMEEWRSTPALMMAANRSPLAERVARLLGLDGPTAKFRVAGMAAGVVCLAGAMLAGNAFLGVAHAAWGSKTNSHQAQTQGQWSAAQEQGSDSTIVVRPSKASTYAKSVASTEQAGKDKDQDKEQKANDQAAGKESYLEGMEAAGFKNLTADELIEMKMQGITPAYVKEIHDLGMKPTADEFIGMRVQGITPEYIREMRTISPNLGVDELIGMKVQGITPQYANEMRGLGLQADADNLIGMKVQGITPQYVTDMHALGLKTDSDDLIGMKVQGISTEYVKGMQALGFKPDTEELIGMKVQGITPDYVRAIEATGLKPDVDNLIEMKVQGITPEYVKSMEDAGFRNADIDELIGAKVQGITPAFIEKARKHGFQNLTLDKLIALKEAGVL